MLRHTERLDGRASPGDNYGHLVSYPSRPVLEVLPQFRSDLKNRYSMFQRDRFDRFVAEQYAAGRSLRELGELMGRTQTAVRRSQRAAVIDNGVHRAPQIRQREGSAETWPPMPTLMPSSNGLALYCTR